MTVKEQLRLRGKYDVINGFEYLASLTNPMFSVSNVEYYAKIVEEKSILRQLIKASNDISHSSYEASETASDILEQAEKSVFNIAQKKTGKSYSLIKDVLIDTFDNLERLATQEDERFR